MYTLNLINKFYLPWVWNLISAHPKTSIFAGVCTALYLRSKFSKKDPPKRQNDQEKGILYLIDEGIDKQWTVTQLVSPDTNAFDKPQKICQWIDKVSDDTEITLVISTKGGNLSACEKILKKLLRHPGGYKVYVKNECYSAGAILSIGAREIIFGQDSYLGKIDPQMSSTLESYSAINYYDLEIYKDGAYCSPDVIDKVRLSRDTLNYLDTLLDLIFKNNTELKDSVKQEMVLSHFPHIKTFDYEECKQIGLPVRMIRGDEMELVDF